MSSLVPTLSESLCHNETRIDHHGEASATNPSPLILFVLLLKPYPPLMLLGLGEIANMARLRVFKNILWASRDHQMGLKISASISILQITAPRLFHSVSGVVRFGKKGKLAPRFVGPFEIIEKVGPVAYQLVLLEELNGVHNTFHVSNLKKCLADPTLQVPLDEIRVDDKLNFVEESIEILEREFKKLKRSRIAIVKVRWNSKRGPEFMWEHEDQMKLKYPYLFSADSS
ncbi:hypothetical protein Tco_0327762 [Tanacetum coccineum]